MKYTFSTVAHDQYWEIEKETFEHMLKCKGWLSSWHHVEETFGYVLESWCDMEAAIHKCTLHSQYSTANNEMRRSRFFDDRAVADRFMLSFLSATRMYLEHMMKELASDAWSHSFTEVEARQLRKKYRSRSAMFLLGDELRNLVQHQSYGVSEVSYASALRDNPSQRSCHEVTLSLPLKSLDVIVQRIRNPGIWSNNQGKKSEKKVGGAKEESREAEVRLLMSLPTPIELRTVMRHFCADLAEMHEEVRGRVVGDVEEAITNYETAYDQQFHDSQGESGVYLCELDAEGCCVRHAWLGSALVERIRYLRDKYSGWQQLRDHIHQTPIGR